MTSPNTAAEVEALRARVEALEAEVQQLREQVTWYEEERNRGGVGMGTDPAGAQPSPPGEPE